MKVLQEIELTSQEVAFVRAICEGLVPSAAAPMAGFHTSTAPHLMRKPRILAAILACAENAKAALAKIEARKEYGASRDPSEGASA
jgi:hypothetical protein